MNEGKISTMDIELKLFNHLSFCWDYFETDGLTDNYIAKLKDDLASPVLLIGGGQGLVSRWLLDAGYHTHTLELHSAMATMAKKTKKCGFTSY